MVLLVLAFLILVAGCQSTSPSMVDLAPDLAKTNGYVYVEYGNKHSLAETKVKNLATDKEYELTYQRLDGVSSLGGWLPEGRYKLIKWGKYALKGYEDFSVKNGHITSLGSFFKFDIGNNEFVVLPMSHSNLANNTSNLTSKLSNFLLSTSPIIWKNPIVPDPIKETIDASGMGLIIDLILRYEHSSGATPMSEQYKNISSPDDFFAFAQSNAKPIMSQPAIGPSGSLYYASELGQIRKRDTTGSWSTLDTGSINDLSAVGYFKNHLIAGDVSGNIKVSSNGGVNWTMIDKVQTGEVIVDIDTSKDTWFVVTQKSDSGGNPTYINLAQVNVYMSKNTASGGLKLVKSIPRDFEAPTVSPIKGMWADNKYYLGAYPNLFVYDSVEDSWQEINTPSPINNFSVGKDGKTITILRLMGSWSSVYTSDNLGAKWKEHPTPPYVTKDVIFDNKSAVLTKLIDYGLTGYGYEPSRHQILSLSEDGKSWIERTKAIKCYRVLKDVNMQPKFCVSLHGSIFKYDGQWIPEVVIH